jgi:hypothetical protein
MLLPTKGVSAERALVTVGSELLEGLETPTSVSGLWEQYSDKERAQATHDRITFDWFSLALAALFAMNLVEWTSAGHLRRSDVH